MDKDSKIYVAGHNGLVGSAIIRELESQGYSNIAYLSSKVLDLRNENSVKDYFSFCKPQYVFLAAAKVGGINHNNTRPAEFIYDNLQIQNNVIHQSYRHGVKKLLFLGSSCIYPKFAQQPIKEEYLLSGGLEPTNEAYSVAKIAGIEMCKMYKRQYGFNAVSAMPTNLYGVNDNFDLSSSHVIPAMIRKFVEARRLGNNEVILWGDGTPMREFLHVDDLARACVFLMNNYDDEMHINIGSNDEYSISELANMISTIVGFSGSIWWDSSYPNGTPRKKLDNTRISKLGWSPEISLYDGLRKTIEWFERTVENE